MAPDIALEQCRSLAPGSVVLDPMAGSGTVLKVAIDQGLDGWGFDTDPLAVLMARVWTTPLASSDLATAASSLVREAHEQFPAPPSLPWIDDDPETAKFVDYWFAPTQQADLRRLSALLIDRCGEVTDALRVALSRIIITKDRGASLARDVSHSRPHRVFNANHFSVMGEFVRSAHRVAQRLRFEVGHGTAIVQNGDARHLVSVADGTVDAIITSPPYLNAIDYIRGHRLALVWLGYEVRGLREVRAESIGAERALNSPLVDDELCEIRGAFGDLSALPARTRRMVDRYLADLSVVMTEARRVLKSGGRATFVVGNSCLQGVFVNNAAAAAAAAQLVGLKEVGRHERDLPPSKRYLPPPAAANSPEISKRMRTEVVLVLAK